MSNKINFETEIKQMIIDVLHLEDISIDEIDANDNLFGDDDGLGLDSIDALELGVAIKKRYDITIDSDSSDTKTHFQSVKTLAEFILANKDKSSI
jgi:acyl carrier protein